MRGILRHREDGHTVHEPMSSQNENKKLDARKSEMGTGQKQESRGSTIVKKMQPEQKNNRKTNKEKKQRSNLRKERCVMTRGRRKSRANDKFGPNKILTKQWRKGSSSRTDDEPSTVAKLRLAEWKTQVPMQNNSARTVMPIVKSKVGVVIVSQCGQLFTAPKKMAKLLPSKTPYSRLGTADEDPSMR